jgi:hypothetical protein
MIAKTTYAVLLIACMFGACQSSNEAKNEDKVPTDTITKPAAAQDKEIPYVVARNYFVKNTVKQGAVFNSKIETPEKFDASFGAAARMGKDGRPTAIDFTKQYVIAIINDETDIATEIKPVSLQKDNETMQLYAHSRSSGGQNSLLPQDLA